VTTREFWTLTIWRTEYWARGLMVGGLLILLIGVLPMFKEFESGIVGGRYAIAGAIMLSTGAGLNFLAHRRP
jgi:hypothetical protein